MPLIWTRRWRLSPADSGGSVRDPADRAPVGRRPAGPGRELRLRVASALVLGPIALVALWLGAVWWWLLVALATIACVAEWVALCARAPQLPAFSLGGGVFAIAAAAAALIWLRLRVGLPDVLMLLLAVWASDIGAYAAGRSLGGPRLAPRISPGKTWAGAAGGLLAACVIGALVPAALGGSALAGTSLAGAGVAGLLALAAQCGDLVESAAKRRFGVKDSGRLMPGHGGLLDRLDGLIAAAPVAAALAMQAGGALVWRR